MRAGKEGSFPTRVPKSLQNGNPHTLGGEKYGTPMRARIVRKESWQPAEGGRCNGELVATPVLWYRELAVGKEMKKQGQTGGRQVGN